MNKHKSCILLTSREYVEELFTLVAKDLPVRSLPPKGLSPPDARKLIYEGCVGETASRVLTPNESESIMHNR